MVLNTIAEKLKRQSKDDFKGRQLGLSQSFLRAAIIAHSPSFSCFVNLLKSEKACQKIILVIDGPVAGKAKALPQP